MINVPAATMSGRVETKSGHLYPEDVFVWRVNNEKNKDCPTSFRKPPLCKSPLPGLHRIRHGANAPKARVSLQLT
jgi:hypothetical protein